MIISFHKQYFVFNTQFVYLPDLNIDGNLLLWFTPPGWYSVIFSAWFPLPMRIQNTIYLVRRYISNALIVICFLKKNLIYSAAIKDDRQNFFWFKTAYIQYKWPMIGQYTFYHWSITMYTLLLIVCWYFEIRMISEQLCFKSYPKLFYVQFHFRASLLMNVANPIV